MVVVSGEILLQDKKERTSKLRWCYMDNWKTGRSYGCFGFKALVFFIDPFCPSYAELSLVVLEDWIYTAHPYESDAEVHRFVRSGADNMGNYRV
jgi:hypothetical protein